MLLLLMLLLPAQLEWLNKNDAISSCASIAEDEMAGDKNQFDDVFVIERRSKALPP